MYISGALEQGRRYCIQHNFSELLPPPPPAIEFVGLLGPSSPLSIDEEEKFMWVYQLGVGGISVNKKTDLSKVSSAYTDPRNSAKYAGAPIIPPLPLPQLSCSSNSKIPTNNTKKFHRTIRIGSPIL